MMLHPGLHSHHRMLLWLWCTSFIALSTALIILVIVATVFVREVLRSLVLVGAAIVLKPAHYFIDIG